MASPTPQKAPGREALLPEGGGAGGERRSSRRHLGRGRWLEQLWHAHVDWHGFGNRRPRLRRAHLRVILSMMDRLAERARSCPRPIQIWVQVQLENAGEDAVYAHTPNPHTKFPAEFGDVRWGSVVPDLLRGLVDPARHEVGLYPPKAVTILIRLRGRALGSDPKSMAPIQ